MKTIQRKLDEIGGTELTNKEKSFFRGGDEGGGCPVTCQLYDLDGDIGHPDCCPYQDPQLCQDEIEAYYRGLTPPLLWFAFCWETEDQ